MCYKLLSHTPSSKSPVKSLQHTRKTSMENFISNLQSFKPSFLFPDVDPNMELLNQCAELNPSVIEPSNMNFQSFMGFCNENLFSQQTPDFTANLADNFPGIFHPANQVNSAPAACGVEDLNESKKRKAIDVSESCSGNSSPPVSETGIKRKNVMNQSSSLLNLSICLNNLSCSSVI